MVSAFLFDVIPFITVSFTTALLVIILTKTPRYMNGLKFYISQYVVFTLFAELVLLFCPCILLHPNVKLLPIGLTTALDFNVVMALCALAGCCLLGCLDCSIAMIFLRYFSLKSASSTARPRIPFYIYVCLISGDVFSFIGCLLCIFLTSLSDIFRESAESTFEIPSFLFTAGFIVLPCVLLLRLSLITVGVVLNVRITQTFKSQHGLSPQVQKSTEALRRLMFIQFFGYFLLLFLPFAIIISVYKFVGQPSNVPTYCFFALLSFGFYDALFTTIFIKPYNKVMFYPLTWLKKSTMSESPTNSRISAITLHN